MRLFISLPVLVMVLAVVLEVSAGPAPSQASPDIASTFESIPNKLKDFGNTLEDTARAAIDHIKPKEILTKTRNWLSETFGKVKEKIKTTFS